MAARKAPRPVPGSTEDLYWQAGRRRDLETRRERWKLPRCQERPSPYIEPEARWLRPLPSPVASDDTASYSELMMHVGAAGGKLLRYHVAQHGGEAVVCTSRGEARGTQGEVLGNEWKRCRLGVIGPAPYEPITATRCWQARADVLENAALNPGLDAKERAFWGQQLDTWVRRKASYMRRWSALLTKRARHERQQHRKYKRVARPFEKKKAAEERARRRAAPRIGWDLD